MSKKGSILKSIYVFCALLVFINMLPLIGKNPILGMVLLWLAFGAPLFIFVIYKKTKKKEFFESKNSLEKIKAMKPAEFEEFVAHIFEKLGYETEEVGGANDGGIDVVAEKDGLKHFIQCKKFITQQVSVGAMRDFYGAMVGKLSDAKGFFITTNVFTLEAEKFAEGKNIELVDGKKLMEYVRLAGIENEIPNRPIFGENVEKICPHCGSQLVLRTARKGTNSGNSFYGCSGFPKCKYTKSI